MVFIDVLRKLRVIVNSDSYRLGTPLPAERILAENLQASRSTVRKAINVLVENGLIERKQGFGNVVINKDPRHSNKQLHSFTEHMAALGRKPHTQVVKFELRVATQGIADILKINVGESLYYVRRVRYAGKQAIEVEDSYLPLNLYRGISIEDLEASKYDYIEGQLGIKIKGCACIRLMQCMTKKSVRYSISVRIQFSLK
ncbi:GntR family transcriptional regulator [Vibrio sp. PP-XX7]